MKFKSILSIVAVALACAVAGWVLPEHVPGALSAFFHATPGVALCAGLLVGVNVPERAGGTMQYPVAAATLIVPGVLVALDANGNAVQGDDVAGLKVVGRSEDYADNSAGAAGDIGVNAKRGVFLYANSATNPLTAVMVGKIAYVEAPDTVASTSTHKVAAGVFISIDPDGVWIDTVLAPLVATGLLTTPAA